MKIRIDNREPRKVINKFKNLDYDDVEVVEERLEIGDIVCGDVCIERKTPDDFVQSIRNKRLQKQLMQMNENYKYGYLIMEGYLGEIYKDPFINNWTTEHEAGAIASVAANYGTVKGPIEVKNTNRLAKTSYKLIEKSGQEQQTMQKAKLSILKEKITGNDVKAMMLSCVPGIGVDKANRIKDDVDLLIVKNDTGENLRISDLTSYDGIGEITAKKILSPFGNNEVDYNDN